MVNDGHVCLVVNMFKTDMPDAVIEVPVGTTRRITRFEYGWPVSVPLDQGLQLQTQFATLRVMTLEQYEEWCRKVGFNDGGRPQVNMRRAEGLGDLLLLAPIIRVLKEMLGYDVDIGVRRNLQWLFEGNPWIRKIRAWDLKGEDRDEYNKSIYFLDEDLDGYSERFAEDRGVNDRTTVFANRFNVKIPDDWKEPYLALTDDMVALGEKALPEAGGVGIQVTTSHDHRDYPYIEALAWALAERGTRVVMLCHWRPFDCPKHDNIVDLMGDSSAGRVLPGIIDRLDAMIAADSGLMHLALAEFVPTVCLFGIISPHLRVAHYTAPKEIMFRNDLKCAGCGDVGMAVCKHAGTGGDKECMKFPVEEVIAALDRLPKREKKARRADSKTEIDMAGKTDFSKAGAVTNQVIPRRAGKLWMTFLFHDEPLELMQRFIDRVCRNDAIEHIVAVDGGAQSELFAMVSGLDKAEVLLWPYQRDYWNMQAMQRNHSFDPVPDGTPAFYMDPDEELNDALADWLPYFAHAQIGYGLIARATWDRRKEYETGQKPHGTHDWPDYQPRFFGPWMRSFKFDGAAHHVCLNTPPQTRIDIDRVILHFEEESGLRSQREELWAKAMARKRELVG